MGAEVAVGTMIAGTALQGLSSLTSSGGGPGTGASKSLARARKKLAAVDRDETLYDLSLQRRDIRSEGARFMGRMRNFVARSGAAGTASGQILRQNAAARIASKLHRIDVTEDRVRRRAAAEMSSADAAIRSHQNRGGGSSGLIGTLLGTAGGIAGAAAQLPFTPDSMIDNSGVADVTGVKPSRTLIGTSVPGGIGGL